MACDDDSPLMLQEAAQAPGVVAAQATDTELYRALAERLRARPPRFALTVARGSSDHAASFARYLLESRLGLVTGTAAPSVVTLYGARLRVADAMVLAISQSGESPDIREVLRQARADGALTVALVNAEAAPLAQVSEFVLPMRAGAEQSVAATKSFIASLASLVRLVGHWHYDDTLLRALDELPGWLIEATQADWSSALPSLRHADRAFVVGRGLGLPIAREMALKLKETCGLHAESFSGAELLHGPVALVEPGFPILMVGTADPTLDGLMAASRVLREIGARVLMASGATQAVRPGQTTLPLPSPLHPVLDPIVAIQAFYGHAVRLAQARGLDPDRPRHLRKITRTL